MKHLLPISLLFLVACAHTEVEDEPALPALDAGSSETAGDDTEQVFTPDVDRPEGGQDEEADAPEEHRITGWRGTVEAMIDLGDVAGRGAEDEDTGCSGTFVLERDEASVTGAAGCSNPLAALDLAGTLEGQLEDDRIVLSWTIELYGLEIVAGAEGAATRELDVRVDADLGDGSLFAVLRGEAVSE